MGRFDQDVVEFLQERKGMLVVLSEDASFFRVLRTAVNKNLAVKTECTIHHVGIQAALRELVSLKKAGRPSILFVDRLLRGEVCTDLILQVTGKFPDVAVIVLTDEMLKDFFVYLHEIGVSNIITKPASVDSIIEKVAFAVKPQGKVNQFLEKGKDFLAAGEFDKALAVSQKILSLKPYHSSALTLQGDACMRLGRREEAVEAYETAYSTSKLFLEPLKRLAEAFKKDKPDLYLDYLKQLDKLSPLNSSRKCAIGSEHARRREMSEAEKYYNLAIEYASKYAMSIMPDIGEKIADDLAGASPQLAEKYLQTVLQAKSDRLTKEDMGMFNRLGILMRRQNRWNEAIANYRKALSISPDDENLHYNMALAQLGGKQTRNALQSLETALSINPDICTAGPAVCYNMAGIFHAAGELKRAEETLQKTLELYPGYTAAARYLDAVQKEMASAPPVQREPEPEPEQEQEPKKKSGEKKGKPITLGF